MIERDKNQQEGWRDSVLNELEPDGLSASQLDALLKNA